MLNNLSIKRLTITAISVVLLLFMSLSQGLVIKSANAQNTDNGSGLSISPTRTELVLAPGSSGDVTISLKNITGGSIIAKMEVNDFAPDNETGEPKLIADSSVKSAESISPFITSGLDDIKLDADQSKDIIISLSIPENATPGGYYGAIRFRAVPDGNGADESQGSAVSLTANLLSLVLVEVPGNIEEKVAVNGIKAYLDDKAGTIFTKKPDAIGVTIENLGNSFIKPFGRVRVNNMRGHEVFSYEINDVNPRSNVLPSSTRVFKDRFFNKETRTINDEQQTIETSPIKWPGRYTITADISYGNGGYVFTVKTTFWYMPSWLIVVLVVLLLGIVGLGFYLYRKYVTKKTSRR